MVKVNRNLKMLICASGIFVSYFYFGIIQEKITRGTYGETKEKFECILSLVLVQCIVNYFYGLLTSAVFSKPSVDTTRISYYIMASGAYLVAMLCSNMALKWVNYPTQVIGKSAKPIPVMVLGVLLGRKSYPFKKYLFVLLVVLGVALFIYKDKAKGSTSKETTFGWGESLLLFSLLMDGVIGAIQERMRSESKTKSGHMMVNMNKWSIVFLSIAVLATQEYVAFIKFVQLHPEILWQLVSFSVASAIGQFFIFLTVSDFGPLPCSIVTTTRKFFTVLASVIIFGNVMLPRQWLATFIVFTGLFLDSFFGKVKKPPGKT